MKTVESWLGILLAGVLAFCYTKPAMSQYSYTNEQGALNDCLSDHQNIVNDSNGTFGRSKLLYISNCNLTFGYYVGYYNWFTLNGTSSSPPYTTSSNWSLTYYFPSGVQKNTGNGGGCDGGEGGTCPKAKGAPLFADPITHKSEI